MAPFTSPTIDIGFATVSTQARVDVVDSATARVATSADIPALEPLVALSVASLSIGYYQPDQIAAALEHVFGVDTQLILDGTYCVVESAGEPIGCGGWNARRTKFGGNDAPGRDATPLDPAVDAARICAFYVHPAHARRGFAALLLRRSEDAAIAAGFGAAELVATLPGVPFYQAHGYFAEDMFMHQAGGIAVPFVPMRKVLYPTRENRAGMTQG